MTARWFAMGAWMGALGVGLGAFGAHAQKARHSAEMIAVWDTAAKYHMIHALALLAAGWACERWPGAYASSAGWLFLAGIAIFSGSLYALAWTGVRAIGALTPIGGACFLAGWVCLAMAALRGR